MTSLGVRRRGRAFLRRLAVRAESNFAFSFAFASPEQRAGLEAIYRFCRDVDDVVDERPHGELGDELAREGLERWRDDVRALQGGRALPAERALALTPLREAIHRFDLPEAAMLEIIEGCAMDLEKTRYESLAELEPYCWRVASCVGFLCLPVFGDTSEAAHRFAHNLGLGMQYTNILRDVGEDAADGRVYLPLRFLREAGIEIDELMSGVYDARFARVARRVAQVARNHYRVAWAALRDCPHRRRLVTAEIMGRTYEEILGALEEADWDVFTRKVKLRRRDKLRIAAKALTAANLRL